MRITMKMTGSDGNLLEMNGYMDATEARWSNTFTRQHKVERWTGGCLTRMTTSLFLPHLFYFKSTRKTGILSFP